VADTLDDAHARRTRRAWCLFDWATSAYPTSILTVFLALYLTGLAEGAAVKSGQPCPGSSALDRCAVTVAGMDVPAGALWGYLLVVATCVQLCALPVVGVIAQRGGQWRRVLIACVVLGAGGTAGLATAAGTDWKLAALFFVLANTGYGGALVVYTAYLPAVAPPGERDVLAARGTGLGYLGSGLVLVGQLTVYLGRDGLGLSEPAAVRWCFLISGLWWAVFSIGPIRVLGRLDPARGGAGDLTADLSVRGQVRDYPLTFAFLGIFFWYGSGIFTVNSVAGQYGERELGLSQDVLIPMLVTLQFIGAAGAVLHGLAARRLGVKTAVRLSLTCWALLICSGYFVRHGDAVSYFLLASGVGLVMGGTVALSRSVFSRLVPRGRAAQYFAVFGIAERLSGALGPLLFAVVGHLTGSYRPAMLSLLVFFVGGVVLLGRFPLARAAAAANSEPDIAPVYPRRSDPVL
jgi:UMF1 family MFS transporter